MSKLAFTPSAGFILVKIADNKSQDILVAQDSDKTPSSQGTVVAIGAPKLHISGGYYLPTVAVGDTVVFKPYGIDSIMIDNEEHRIVDFDNIRGKLNEED